MFAGVAEEDARIGGGAGVGRGRDADGDADAADGESRGFSVGVRRYVFSVSGIVEEDARHEYGGDGNEGARAWGWIRIALALRRRRERGGAEEGSGEFQ